MLKRTEGIVLKTNPFGEADLIVTCLSKDYGILKTFAKSPRKIKSRFGSSLEPLTHSKISFWGKEDAALPRLVQSDIIYTFHSLRSDFRCFLRVSELVELTLCFVPERDASRHAYHLLINTLRTIEDDRDMDLLILYYKLNLLNIAGFSPKLDNCGRCGKSGDAFYLSHGSVLCERCSDGTEPSFRISKGAISFSSTLLGWSPLKLNRIRPARFLIPELTKITDAHIKYVVEKNLRTRSFRVFQPL